MIEALAIAGGIGTTVALVGVVVLAFKLSSARQAETAAVRDASAEREARVNVVASRDLERERAEKAEAQIADLMKRLLATEEHVADLSAKLARAVIARAQAPVSQDGADAVNDLFAAPLKTKERP